ncbi:hypothetical protein GQ600_26854 [Phytophthora cactorum]|nr:hypothetical protein GQ600_26854 [Phytophthora cactorum]
MEKNMYVQIIVWDCETMQGGKCNTEFDTGAVYMLHQVEYVGIYDTVAKGYVVYDPTRDSQIELISSPLRRPQRASRDTQETDRVQGHSSAVRQTRQ